jgi:hypothetical protein
MNLVECEFLRCVARALLQRYPFDPLGKPKRKPPALLSCQPRRFLAGSDVLRTAAGHLLHELRLFFAGDAARLQHFKHHHLACRESCCLRPGKLGLTRPGCQDLERLLSSPLLAQAEKLGLLPRDPLAPLPGRTLDRLSGLPLLVLAGYPLRLELRETLLLFQRKTTQLSARYRQLLEVRGSLCLSASARDPRDAHEQRSLVAGEALRIGARTALGLFFEEPVLLTTRPLDLRRDLLEGAHQEAPGEESPGPIARKPSPTHELFQRTRLRKLRQRRLFRRLE